MTTSTRAEAMPQELVLAIGLVWGHLNVGQYRQAYQLAYGSLRVWPAAEALHAMAAFAAIELGLPLDDKARSALGNTDWQEWSDVVLRRAQGRQEVANT